MLDTISAPGYTQYFQYIQERAVVLLFTMGGEMSVAGCSAVVLHSTSSPRHQPTDMKGGASKKVKF